MRQARKRLSALGLLLGVYLLSFGNIVAGEPAKKNSDLTFMQIKFATFYVPQMKGKPQAVTVTAGSATRGNEMVGVERAVIGDLDNDGLDDGAVIFWDNDGSDSYWKYCGAFLSKNGQAIHVDSQPLGDRTVVQSMSINKGKIEINMLTAPAPNAPASQKKTVTYMLKDGHLVLTENVPKSPAKPIPKVPIGPKKQQFTRNLS